MKVELDFSVEELAERLAAILLEHDAAPPAGEPWRLLDVGEVAVVLGRSRRWVHGAVKDRGLPFIRLDGGALAFDLEDVRTWARARRVPAEMGDPLAGRLRSSGKPAWNGPSDRRSRTAMQKARA